MHLLTMILVKLYYTTNRRPTCIIISLQVVAAKKRELYMYIQTLERATTLNARICSVRYLNDAVCFLHGTVRFVRGMVRFLYSTVRFLHDTLC